MRPHSLPSLAAAAIFALPFTASAQEARTPQIVVTGTVGDPSGIALASENDNVSALLYRDNGDDTIWVRRSDGRGLNWGPATRIDSDASNADKSTGRHSLVVDGTHVYAAWLDKRDGGEDDVYFNSSADGGATWMASDLRIDDSFAPGIRDVKDFRIASSGNDVVALLSVEDGFERLFITWSNDGGQTWEDAIPASGHNGIGDIDDIALAASADRAYFAWRDNFTNGIDDTIWFGSFDLNTGQFIQQDLSISPNLNAAGGDADDQVEIAVDNGFVAVIFHADNLGTTAEQVRLAYSTDFGTTWSPDAQVGQYNNATLGHDVDDATVLVEDGFAAVAWTDNRTTVDQIYVATVDLTLGVAAADHLCSDSATGANAPRLAGEFGSETLAVAWNQTVGRVAKSCAYRNGAWSDSFLLSQNAADVSNVRLAWNDVYDNFLCVWIAAENLTDEVYAGGYRYQQLQDDPITAGALATFNVSGFEAGRDFQVVAAASLGSFQLPDGRDLGVPFDFYVKQSLALTELTGTINANGDGATQPLIIPVVLAGTNLQMVAASLDSMGNLIDLTDATLVEVQ